MILIGLAIVGFFQSSTETNLVAQQLESVIKRNQELIEHATAKKVLQLIRIRNRIKRTNCSGVCNFCRRFDFASSFTDKVQELFPKATIDGKVGGRCILAAATLQELIAKDKMANRVVTLLGTNGTFFSKTIRWNIFVSLEKRELYFVTIFAPVKWNNEVNQQLLEAKTRHANVHIIDWYELAKNHADWFYEDKIHPNNQGASEELARYLLDSITQN